MNPLEKIKKASTIKETSILSKSKIYGKKDMAPTDVPAVNLALSGKIDGGLAPGTTMIAGPSKHFKSMFALFLASAYMKHRPDAVMLFYDNEFGTPESYFEAFDIDPERVVHVPIIDVEQLKHDIINQLTTLEKEDDVVIVIDSIGNIASRKEIEDAKKGDIKAEMQRAKSLKSFWRMVTPYLNIKDIPLIAVNHSYQTIEMFSKQQVSGGTGGIYSADNIWLIGRQQHKKSGGPLLGYNFIIKLDKSRFAKEGSKIPITVMFDGGLQKWSGMFDIAKEAGYIQQSGRGWYESINPETGEVISDKKFQEADTLTSDEIWNNIFQKTNFKQFVEQVYAYGGGKFELFVDEMPDGDEEPQGEEDEEQSG